ncbi:hypothetical protein QQ045_021939 [Rhodiola kirilowii]
MASYWARSHSGIRSLNSTASLTRGVTYYGLSAFRKLLSSAFCATESSSRCNYTNGYGKLILGGEVTEDGVVSVPIVPQPDPTFYSVTLTGISVGTTLLPFKPDGSDVKLGNVIFDSGTPPLLLPKEIRGRLIAELRKVPEGLHCLGVDGVHGEGGIIGNFAQANFLIGMDWDKLTVSFKATDCLVVWTLEEAEARIRSMPVKADTVIWKTLLSACKMHKNEEIAKRAAEEIIDLDPNDAVSYVTLSNIHASAHKSHTCSNESISYLNELTNDLKLRGYMPDISSVLHDMDSEEKEQNLVHHSEKLAVAFALVMTTADAPIRIMKNLRMCSDCHVFIKFISELKEREIIVRHSGELNGDVWIEMEVMRLRFVLVGERRVLLLEVTHLTWSSLLLHPKTDDPTLPVVTFRMWVLGITACVLLSFVNQFFWYRKQPLSVSSIAAQIAVVPLGHLMARTITERVFFEGSAWQFTLNPGPFNVKEHVLITIFANSGAGSVYAISLLSAVKLIYKRKLDFLPAMLLMITTQTLGFGWAGLYRIYLVEPGEMWWPSNLVQVSLFGALHDKAKRPKGGTTTTQFFLIVFLCSFAYYVLPGYLFAMLSSISWVCWLTPKSVLVQQLGSGLNGLGIGAIGLDWSTIASYLGSPLASPCFATANVAVGFFLFMYLMAPLAYWYDLFKAKNFPIYSSHLFVGNGSRYHISEIVNDRIELDKVVYGNYGQVYLSTLFAMSYGFGFATLSATVVHVSLFHGSDIWNQTKSAFGGRRVDVHTRLMQKYKQVPMWWFLIIFALSLAAVLFGCHYYIETLQLPWWGVLLARAIAMFFTLPIGIIAATTNQTQGLNIITEYIIGYMYPGRPVANMCFKVYGYISMAQALTFVSDLKLGHYMKIPPRSMFMAQVVGTFVSVMVYLGTAWWLMGAIPNLCDTSLLPSNSPWTCTTDRVFFDASVIWGLVGPQRIFGDLGVYPKINYFFIMGAVAPFLVWVATKTFKSQKWIRLIHMPVLLGATSVLPPASAVNFTSWIILAFVSGYVIFKYKQKWWQRYNYILSGGLDAGTAFMTILLFITLGSRGVRLDWWGNNPEGCPLATCPTAKGVTVAGCPTF